MSADHQSRHPQVSVIMAAHNAERFVGESIGSLQAQTEPDWELICVDDCSTDGTPEILRACARADARIKVFSNAENAGPACSRNIAVSHARGQYVAVLDADDVALPDRIKRTLNIFRTEADVVLVGSEALVMDGDGTELSLGEPIGPEREDMTTRMLRSRNRLAHSSVMMPADIMRQIGGYDEFFRYSMDYDLYLRASRRGRVLRLRPPLARYRYSCGHITARRWLQQRAYAETARIRAGLLDEGKPCPPLEEIYGRQLRRIQDEHHLTPKRLRAWPHYQIGSFYLRGGQYRKANREFWRAWMSDPLWLRPAARLLFSIGCPPLARDLTRRHRRRLEGV